ncbi:hypothetical protein SAMN05421676_10125 [Salinibacillus kushneri]|uniref:Uncharacterized protein n=1 Tax=Salinibacillus kushneri TaxID=237682 RepID=A0A1H9Y4S7_9BACI|nr:hypothetical protein [Salinibacillus kushneri]SES63834.1 hypothetical protein SAMN05421676_10125 [Salinibacillus kushneri]
MLKNKWEAYANISQSDAIQLFKQILKEQHIKYDMERAPPNVMYDPNHEQLIMKAEGFVLTIIYVSADPITRIFTSLLGTFRHFNGISLLSVKYNNKVSHILPVILHKFATQCPHPPWNITKYPRFRFAVLLQMFTKLKWKRFLNR